MPNGLSLTVSEVGIEDAPHRRQPALRGRRGKRKRITSIAEIMVNVTVFIHGMGRDVKFGGDPSLGSGQAPDRGQRLL